MSNKTGLPKPLPIELWANSYSHSDGLYSDVPVKVYLDHRVDENTYDPAEEEVMGMSPPYLYFSNHRAFNHCLRIACLGEAEGNFASTDYKEVEIWTAGVKTVLNQMKNCLQVLNHEVGDTKGLASWHGRDGKGSGMIGSDLLDALERRNAKKD